MDYNEKQFSLNGACNWGIGIFIDLFFDKMSNGDILENLAGFNKLN